MFFWYSVLNIYWKDWCWSWNSSTLATWCKALTHLKRPWCWERLKAGGKGDDRGWDGWMASQTQWTWVWVGSGSWWWTRRPGLLQSMGSQSQTRLSNWPDLLTDVPILLYLTKSMSKGVKELSQKFWIQIEGIVEITFIYGLQSRKMRPKDISLIESSVYLIQRPCMII